MVYVLPEFLGGHDLSYLFTCVFGYSNILFGLMMVSAGMQGQKYANYFGLEVRKVYIPWIMLIFTKLTVPESSFSGHIFGIFAALIIKHSGCYNIKLLPLFEAI